MTIVSYLLCFYSWSPIYSSLPLFFFLTILLHLLPTISMPQHLSHSCSLALSVFFRFSSTFSGPNSQSFAWLLSFSPHNFLPFPSTHPYASNLVPTLSCHPQPFTSFLSSLSHPSLLLTFHLPPTPYSLPGLAAVCSNAFWPLPPSTHRHTQNLMWGQNRDETKERMNKTVELMVMVTAPRGPTLLIYNGGWAFKSRYSLGSLLTASLRSTLQWERDRDREIQMGREERWETRKQKTLSEIFLFPELGKILKHNSALDIFNVYIFSLKGGLPSGF